VKSDELNRLANASPIGDSQVAALRLGEAGAELMQEIMVARAASETDGSGQQSTWRRVPTPRAAAALAGLVAVAVISFAAIGSPGGDNRPTFAAAAIRIAEANPRLLVTAPGWYVTRADEFTAESGEMTFSDGGHELDVNWQPADEYDGYFRDRAADGGPQTEIDLLGQRATMFRYAGTSDFTTLLRPQGKSFVEIRADGLGSADAYMALVQSLEPTDVETWLAAMPASVVQPTDRAATVEAMLRGIPLPPGFGVAKLESGGTASDRYQLGAKVTGAVACDWLDRWTAALAAGDAAGAEEARQAMATSPGWPILLEMEKQGDYPNVLWDYADDLKGGGGFGPNTNGNYSAALGCAPN
jgi:hypothetical protein